MFLTLRMRQVVSLHCNLDENTKHLINAERLNMMKPDAVLVNAARGPVIDETALVAHLKANPNFRCCLEFCGDYQWRRCFILDKSKTDRANQHCGGGR